ncbi:tetratricopeptide repeat protein [Silvibacterium sp.]|uniref:tetratricopeptide repeat protein n=1 Tax=Silvibacterium sp. TaxID=1964179 RepID=UPI0039E2CE48
MKFLSRPCLFFAGALLLAAPLFAQTATTPATGTQAEIAAHARKAQEYLREKKPELAIPELEAWVKLDPQNVDVQANLGVLLFFRGNYAGALPHLRQAVALQPGLAKIQGLLGITERNTGDLAAARIDMEAAFPLITETKFKTQLGLSLIELYSATGELDKAAATVAELRRNDPENVEVLYAAYRIHSDLAAESIVSLSLVDPDSPQMHQVMAHEETREGKTNEAIAEYRKAIALDPKLPGVHFELAELLNTSSDPKLKQEAIAEYEEALKQNPGDEKSLERIGDAAAAKNDWTQAKPAYEKAVALRPDDAEANFGLAKTYIALDQKDKALPLLEHVVQVDPTNATAHYRLSTLFREQGNAEQAKAELEQFQKYRQMKDKLRAMYKELQIQPDQIRDDPKDDASLPKN